MNSKLVWFLKCRKSLLTIFQKLVKICAGITYAIITLRRWLFWHFSRLKPVSCLVWLDRLFGNFVTLPCFNLYVIAKFSLVIFVHKGFRPLNWSLAIISTKTPKVVYFRTFIDNSGNVLFTVFLRHNHRMVDST